MLFDQSTKTAKFIDFGTSEDLQNKESNRFINYWTALYTKKNELGACVTR